MKPSNFPVECLEDIFRHLGARDLLACCLVDPEWNDCIGSTSSCMMKFKLVYYSFCSMEGVLIRSKRKYKRLEYRRHYFFEIPKNVLRLREWTHVDCKNSRFSGLKQFLDFLQTFHFSVRELTVDSLGFVDRWNDLSIELLDLQFPNLKTLTINGSVAAIYDKAFSGCKSLTSLSITTNEEMFFYLFPQSALDAIRTSLNSNKDLKEINIDGRLVSAKDFSSGFKLRSLLKNRASKN